MKRRAFVVVVSSLLALALLVACSPREPSITTVPSKLPAVVRASCVLLRAVTNDDAAIEVCATAEELAPLIPEILSHREAPPAPASLAFSVALEPPKKRIARRKCVAWQEASAGDGGAVEGGGSMPPMDQELRDALGSILTVASDAAREARNANANSKEALSEVSRLRHDVFGSKPPPPPAPGVEPAAIVPLARRVADSHAEITETAADVDDFKGSVLRELAEVRSELAKQSNAMGLGEGARKLGAWVRSRDGRVFLAAAAAALVGLANMVKGSSPAMVAAAPPPVRVELVTATAPSSAPSASSASSASSAAPSVASNVDAGAGVR